MFRAPYALCQEVKIVLYSLWYYHTYRWPSRAQVERGRCTVSKISKNASTCFERHMLIVMRSKLYYTASGIITPIGGCPAHNLCTGQHMVLETCSGMK